jgi:predicted Na+-dependent transporter
MNALSIIAIILVVSFGLPVVVGDLLRDLKNPDWSERSKTVLMDVSMICILLAAIVVLVGNTTKGL